MVLALHDRGLAGAAGGAGARAIGFAGRGENLKSESHQGLSLAESFEHLPRAQMKRRAQALAYRGDYRALGIYLAVFRHEQLHGLQLAIA